MKSKQTSRIYFEGYDHKDALYLTDYEDKWVYFPKKDTKYDKDGIPCFANQILISGDNRLIDCWAWHKVYDDTWLEDSYFFCSRESYYDSQFDYCFPHYKCVWHDTWPQDFVHGSDGIIYSSNNYHLSFYWYYSIRENYGYNPRDGQYHYDDQGQVVSKITYTTDGMVFTLKNLKYPFNNGKYVIDHKPLIAKNGVYFIVQYAKNYNYQDAIVLNNDGYKSLYYVPFDHEKQVFGSEIKLIISDMNDILHEDLYYQYDSYSVWEEKNTDYGVIPGTLFVLGNYLFYIFRKYNKVYEGKNDRGEDIYRYYIQEMVYRINSSGHHDLVFYGNYFRGQEYYDLPGDDYNYTILALDTDKAYIFGEQVGQYDLATGYTSKIFSIDINGNYELLQEASSYNQYWAPTDQARPYIINYLVCTGQDDHEIFDYYSSSTFWYPTPFIKDNKTGYYYRYMILKANNLIWYKKDSNAAITIVARTKDFKHFEIKDNLTYRILTDKNGSGKKVGVLFDGTYYNEMVNTYNPEIVIQVPYILCKNPYMHETVYTVRNYKYRYTRLNKFPAFAPLDGNSESTVWMGNNGKIGHGHGIVLTSGSSMEAFTNLVYFDDMFFSPTNKDFFCITNESQTLLNQLNGLDYPGKET